MELVLKADEGALEFNVVADNGWTQLFLTHEGQRLRLGADVVDVICDRLLGRLSFTGTRDFLGSVDGIEVCWVLTLAEESASVYAGRRDGALILLFQDADAKLVGRMALTEEKLGEWRDAIATFMQRSGQPSPTRT